MADGCQPCLVREAALWRGLTVGLYGGSFNPAHEGHVHIGKAALARLGLDAVWFLPSPSNPLKAEAGMAPYDRRKASIAALAGSHPRLQVNDLELRLGTRYTADTLAALKRLMPATRFVWLMGADNLVQFNRWRRWREIADAVPIAVFDRPGYALSGLASEFARVYARCRVKPRGFAKAEAPAWTFVTLPRHTGSATQIRQKTGLKW